MLEYVIGTHSIKCIIRIHRIKQDEHGSDSEATPHVEEWGRLMPWKKEFTLTILLEFSDWLILDTIS